MKVRHLFAMVSSFGENFPFWDNLPLNSLLLKSLLTWLVWEFRPSPIGKCFFPFKSLNRHIGKGGKQISLKGNQQIHLSQWVFSFGDAWLSSNESDHFFWNGSSLRKHLVWRRLWIGFRSELRSLGAGLYPQQGVYRRQLMNIDVDISLPSSF